MKKILLFLLLVLSFHTYGKDKKTIIDRINEAKVIPVYIIHDEVSIVKYKFESGKVRLTVEEGMSPTVNAIMPSGIDTVKNGLLELLKKEFSSDKFVFIKSGTKNAVSKEISDKKLDFVVVYHFKASYKYDYINAKPRREASVFVSFRELSGACNVGFYKTSEYNTDLIKYNNQGALVHDSGSFKVNGFQENANVLMGIKSPLVLIAKMEFQLNKATVKLADRLKKKHEKVVSKRK